MSQPKGRLMPFIAGLVGGVLACLLYQWLNEFGTKTYPYDLNRDGTPDEIRIYQNGYLTESSWDRNFDGVADLWAYFDFRGRRTYGKADDNFDGLPDDTWTYKDGILVTGELDTDFNGTPDVTQFFKHEQLTRSLWRPNGTNVVTRREIFLHGVLVEESTDTNMDGLFDLTTLFDPFLNPIPTNQFKLTSPSSK